MTTNFSFIRLASILLFAFLSLTASFDLVAQENEPVDSQGFKIVIEKTESGIKLQCIEGCEWFGLTFDLDNDRPRSIDQYGVRDIEESFSEGVVDPAIFLFTINRIESGLALKGIEGTDWVDLRIYLSNNEKQAIDQFGLTSLD